MIRCFKRFGRGYFALVMVLLLAGSKHIFAFEFVQRLSLLGEVSEPNSYQARSFDRESLRGMLDHVDAERAFSMHALVQRSNWSGQPPQWINQEIPFRLSDLSADVNDRLPEDAGDQLELTLDYLLYKQSFNDIHFTLGRQPIDWGAGRLWQAHNVFGAFLPTALDIEFKPGVDAMLVEYYPTQYSELSLIGVANNPALTGEAISVASYYKTLVEQESELSVLLGRISEEDVLGLGFESAVGGLGYRVEGSVSVDEDDQSRIQLVSGMDYQFNSGVTTVLEWRFNQIIRIPEFTDLSRNDPDIMSSAYFRPQKIDTHAVGLVMAKDLSPLLNGSVLVICPAEQDELWVANTLHQLNFTYSLSDESVLVFSMLYLNGNAKRSDPTFKEDSRSATLNVRMYF